MTGPKRIQLSRAKGWRKPEGAIVVARPSVYGNPWTLADAAHYFPGPGRERERRAWAVAQYARELRERGGTGELEFVTTAQIRSALAGHDLACWCPLDQPCHADVLIEVAHA